MSRRLPSLNALRAFEAAARHVCFTLAAAELNVTHAAVSRHIRELEAWASTKLFHRTGRGVELTEAGNELSRDLTIAFNQLAAATERFAPPARGRHQLAITSEVPFAALWLVPRLGSFIANHPKIDLVLDPDNRLADFARNEADLGIRYGRGGWRDVEAVKLLDCVTSPVASPRYVKSLGISSPRDLIKATLLQDESKRQWLEWFKAAGVAEDVSISGPILKGHLALAAAETGQGVALADNIMAGDAIAAGRLVRPFAIGLREHAYYLVRQAGRPETPAMRAFRVWLQGELQAFSHLTMDGLAGISSASTTKQSRHN